MRRNPRTVPVLAVALIGCVSRGPRDGATALLSVLQDNTVIVTRFDVDQGQIGTNVFRATVRNNASTPIPFGMSLRTESPSHGLQKSHYRLLQPRETADLVYTYELPDEGYRLLIAFYGPVQSMPTEQNPFPAFTVRQLKRFARFPAAVADRQDVHRPSADPIARANAAEHDGARRRLLELLGWDRPRSPAFHPHTTGRDSIGPYSLEAIQIATENDRAIDLLFLRRAEACGRLPTVLYLSGNPPGRKESGIVPGMFLADLGFQVVAMDRRESARLTRRGEYLSAIADPVFDARVALDYVGVPKAIPLLRLTQPSHGAAASGAEAFAGPDRSPRPTDRALWGISIGRPSAGEVSGDGDQRSRRLSHHAEE